MYYKRVLLSLTTSFIRQWSVIVRHSTETAFQGKIKLFYFASVILALIGCSLSKIIDRSTVCRLPVDGGLCYGNFPRFAFDPEQSRCVSFVYGGCQGNANRFDTLDRCRQYCEEL